MGSAWLRGLRRRAEHLPAAGTISHAGGQARPNGLPRGRRLHRRRQDRPGAPWHVVQVMIYMYALPQALTQYRDVRLIRGSVVYPSRTVKVPPGSLYNQFKEDLRSLIRRLAA